MLLAACSSGHYSSPPAPAATTTTAGPEVTVRGVVAGIFASARVVTLREPVSGVSHIALTTDTEVVRANGARAGLGDIAPGSGVEAVGRPGMPDTLVARRVVLL